MHGVFSFFRVKTIKKNKKSGYKSIIRIFRVKTDRAGSV